METLFWILVSIAAGYLIIVLWMYFMQSGVIYHPRQTIHSTPSSLGYDYEDVKFETEDGLTLHGWFVPAESSSLTVLYFHGNAGNISGRMETIQLLHDLGLDLFIFDYRGYGKSEGSPTEEGTYRDAAAAWNYLTDNRNKKAGNIIIMGRSLGGAIASWLAARRNPGAAVIESSFTSAADLGSDLYPWLPVQWLLKYDYKSLSHVQQIEAPLFVAHSPDDQVVPFRHSLRLYEAANEPKTFVELTGSHGYGFVETGAKYRDSLQAFLKEHFEY